jgi:hypothetical protein
MIRTATLFLAALLLSSCGYNTDAMLRQSVGYECVEAEGEVGGFLCAENGQPVTQVSRYCYRTLGKINCLDRPDPDRQNAPVGSGG